MSKLTNEKKRTIAERLFINEGLTAKAISEQLDVTEKTVGKWRKGRPNEKGWDERRAEVLSAPHKIKEILLEQLQLVANGEKPTVNTDALSKISKVMESISGKVSVQVVISVFKEFDNWMVEQDPNKASEFTHWHKMFLHHKAEIDG